MMIGMGREGGGVDFLDQRLIGGVFAAFEFVADDRHLGLAVLLAQPEMAHAIGLDGHVAFEVVAGDVGVVVGAVARGGGVVAAADTFEVLVDRVALGAVEFRAALEHQVFEQVGGAGDAEAFVARAHAIGDHEREHRRGVILQQQHAEAVARELVFGDPAERADGLETGGRRGLGGGEARGEGENRGEKQRERKRAGEFHGKSTGAG